MPLQRRLPKRGFSSLTARYNDEVALYEIQVMKADVIDLDALKAENLVGHAVRKVKIIKTGETDPGSHHQGPGGHQGRRGRYRGCRRQGRVMSRSRHRWRKR